MPIYAKDRKYLDRAIEHFTANDYKAAAVYLRTHFEYIIKRFCEKHAIPVKFKEELRELSSDEFWKAIKAAKAAAPPPAPAAAKWSAFTSALVLDVEQSRKIVLNPLSHSVITSVHRKEIDDAIKAIQALETALNAIPKNKN